jgi:hypothetical protein
MEATTGAGSSGGKGLYILAHDSIMHCKRPFVYILIAVALVNDNTLLVQLLQPSDEGRSQVAGL